MSFQPLAPGINQSLLGVARPRDLRTLTERRLSGGKKSGVVIAVIVSAIIFVTVISIYDVIRNLFNAYYTKIALEDPRSQNTPQQINSTNIANKQALYASIAFSAFCIITSIILVYLLIKYL
jgi:hypothetical protein